MVFHHKEELKSSREIATMNKNGSRVTGDPSHTSHSIPDDRDSCVERSVPILWQLPRRFNVRKRSVHRSRLGGVRLPLPQGCEVGKQHGAYHPPDRSVHGRARCAVACRYAGLRRGHVHQPRPDPSLALVLLIASVPVALPATFILTTSLGAQKLAKSGIQVTRLSSGISVRLTNPS